MPNNLQSEMANQESYLIIREKYLLYTELSAARKLIWWEENVLDCKSHSILSCQSLVIIPPVQTARLRMCTEERVLAEVYSRFNFW